jgi:tetratricopeptide (TPR) repeat protein
MAMGVGLVYERRFEESNEFYRKALEMDPGYVAARSNLANTHMYLRRYDEALADWETVARLAPEGIPPDLVAEVRRGYESGGERGFWEAYLEGLRSRPGMLWSRVFDMAIACAQLGRIDEAFALIDQLLAERSAYAEQIPFDPGLDPLRSDPRFDRVLEKLGLR